MNFSINSKTLASALSALVRVVDPKSTLLILQNFKFTLSAEGLLTIKGMSTEADAEQTIATTEHEGAGALCVNARQLTDFVKKLPDCGVSFTYDGLQLEILAGKGKFVIPVIPAEQYPEGREVKGESIDIPAQTLIDGFSRSKFAVSSDEFRPTMQGVLIDVLPDKMVFVATDTRVLVRYTFDCATGKTMSAILPARAIALVTSMFAKCESVRLTISDNSALFEAENLRLATTLLHGRFPDYNRVISNRGQFSIDVNKKSLTSAIERVRSFGDSASNLIVITVGGMFGELRVSATNDGAATSGNDYVPCETGCGNLTLGMNADYLLSVLAALQNENVVFSNLTEGTASMPVHFIEPGEGKEYLALLMPMTVAKL